MEFTKNLLKLSNLTENELDNWCALTIESISINRADNINSYITGMYINNIPKTCKAIRSGRSRCNNIALLKNDLELVENSIVLEKSNMVLNKIVETNWKLYNKK